MAQDDRLSAYLARIGLPSAPRANPAGLARLQAAHRQAITFENIDVLLRRPIAIDSAAVFEKLVRDGRGGYCFEQNRLFADVLSLAGVETRPLLARVRLAVPEGVVPARSHVLLLAGIDGRSWIADVGFGGSYVPPLPLEEGAQAQTADGARHRLRRTGDAFGEWLLERAGPQATTDGRAEAHEDWQPQYSFDLAPVAPLDLEQANHWTATLPGSRFLTAPRLSIVLPDGFAALSGVELSITRGPATTRREIGDAPEWRAVAAETFRLHLSREEVEALSLFG